MEDAEKVKKQETEVQCKLTVSKDNLAVLISCSSELVAKQELLFKDIQAQKENLGIVGELDKKGLVSAIIKAKSSGEGITGLVILKGRPPVKPIDGKIEWLKDFFAEGYYVDPETKVIDYRQKAAAPSVTEGEALVKVFPETDGEDGCDVYGKVVRALPPKKVELRAGPNVVWDEENNEYKAKCSGRLSFKGSTIDVMNVYIISGDVGPETGNIQHNGNVKINGEVISNFKIEATGDIEIKGLVGACDIVCGGDLTIKGGINGSLEKKIIVNGNAFLKYSNNVLIECDGDIHVDVEVHQSQLYCCGRINCDGIIMGSRVMAAKGIIVTEAGSKASSDTSLISGVDYKLLKAVKKATEERNIAKKELKVFEIKLKKLKQIGNMLNNEQKETITEIQFHIIESNNKIAELLEEEKNIRKLINANRDAEIEINDLVYTDTILRVLDTQLRVSETLKGPLVARIDNTTSKIGLFSKNDEDSEK